MQSRYQKIVSLAQSVEHGANKFVTVYAKVSLHESQSKKSSANIFRRSTVRARYGTRRFLFGWQLQSAMFVGTR